MSSFYKKKQPRRWNGLYRSTAMLLVFSLVIQPWLLRGISVAQTVCTGAGDVVRDGFCTPNDVVQTLQHYLGTADPALTQDEQDRANVLAPNVTGVTPADARCIFQRFLGLTSCLDNAPPVLAPIGDQSVTLGTALILQVNASDPDGEAVQLTVTPFPLPRNASFVRPTGRFVFRPDAAQVGTFELTFTASDGLNSVFETITVTVLPGTGETALSGTVLTTAEAPLADVRLEVAGIETRSAADGSFRLSGLPPGAQRILIDGSTVAPALGTFATVPEVVTLLAGTDNVLQAPIFLLPLDVASADPIDPTQESVIDSSPLVINGETFPPVVMTVPAGTARDDTGELFAGNIHISQIPAPTLGPMPLPDDIDLSVYIAVQPFGVRYDPPIPIDFPNVENFPVDAIVDIFGLNHDTGVFEKVGEGQVVRTGQGTIVRSIGGVVRENSWHGFVPQPPIGSTDPGDRPRCSGDCRQGIGSSSVDPRTGDLGIEHDLVAYRSLERNRTLRLEYHSSTAFVAPLVSVLVTTGNLTPPPLFMATEVALGGVTRERIVTAGPSFCTTSTCPFARQSQVVDASALPTGIYPATIQVDCQFPVSRRSRTFTRNVAVLNSRQSPIGAGWGVQGLQRLQRTATGTLLLTQGDDNALEFTPAMRAAAEIGASGEQDIYHFAANRGDVVSLRMRRRSNQPNGSGSLNPSVELRTSQGIVVARDDDSGTTTPDGPGNNALIASVTLPATDNYTVVTKGQGGTRGAYELFLTASQNALLTAAPSTSANDPATIEAVVLPPPGVFSTLQRHADGSFTRRMQDGRSFLFNAQGLLTAATDRHGNTMQYRYNAAEHLIAVEDPVGLITTLRYTDGLLSAIEDPLGRLTRFQHDATGNLVRITDPDEMTRAFTYDRDHLMRSQTNKRGLVTQYEYDFAGRFVRSLRPDDSVVSLVANQSVGLVDPASGLGSEANPALLTSADDVRSTFTDGNNNSVTIAATDALGNPARIVDALGRETQIERDDNGFPTRIVAPSGAVTALTYDDRGNVTAIREAVGTPLERERRLTYDPIFSLIVDDIDPDGNVTTAGYDAQGNLRSIVDAFGHTRAFTYDDRGLLHTTTDENGHTTTFTYDTQGNLETQTDALGNVQRFTRDGSGYLTALTEAEGSSSERTSVLTYDAHNRLLTLTNGLEGEPLRFGYDATGNLVEFVTPTGGRSLTTYDEMNRPIMVDDSIRGNTQFLYDASDNLIRTVDALGNITTIVYDAANRPTQTVNPAQGVQRFTYDVQDNVLSFEDARENTTRFTYDILNRLTQQSNPLGQSTTFAYDARDNLVMLTDAGGQITRFTYDTRSRLTQRLTPDNTTTLTYDAASNLLRIEDDDSAIELTYDALNRIRQERTLDRGNQPEITLTTLYNAIGNRQQVDDSLGGITRLTYDLAERLTQLTTPASDVIALRYDAANRLTRLQFPNSVVSNYQYDPQGRLTNLTQDGTTVLQDLTYSYNDIGLLESIAEATQTRQYTYDALRRVSGAGTTAAPETYQYDAAGNRLTSFLSSTHRHNAADRLLEDDTFTYTYDASGNLATQTTGSNGAVTTYDFDAQNQLTRITFADGTTATYRYDGLGRRFEKNINGTITRYVYDGPHIAMEFDGDNTLTARYSYGALLDQPLSMMRNGQRFFYQVDHLGSVLSLTDSHGDAVNTYTYDAYGRLGEHQEGVRNPFTYTGRERDSESGLYYYRARYYDPQSGRFLSEEPILLNPREIHKYLYAQANPVNLIDPTGEFGLLLIGGLLIVAAGVGVAILALKDTAEAAEQGGRNRRNLQALDFRTGPIIQAERKNLMRSVQEVQEGASEIASTLPGTSLTGPVEGAPACTITAGTTQTVLAPLNQFPEGPQRPLAERLLRFGVSLVPLGQEGLDIFDEANRFIELETRRRELNLRNLRK